MKVKENLSTFWLLTSTLLFAVRGSECRPHHLQFRGKKLALHLVPSGILNEETGNGVVIHLPGLFKEIDGLESNGVPCKGRFLVSGRAHLLFDLHHEVNGLREAELAKSFIGTVPLKEGLDRVTQVKLSELAVI